MLLSHPGIGRKEADFIPYDENAELLQTMLPFWDTLPEQDRELLRAAARPVTYRQGQNIHSPSHECVGVLLIISGELRCYLLSESGKEVTLFRLSKGEVCVLSASCLLSSITFDVLIDAQQDTQVLLIGTDAFAQVQSRSLQAENFALRVAADRFSDVVWAMEQILFMSFDARLAVFLLDETSKTGTDNLTLTHEQIAKYIGSAREVVSRMLKYFQSEGIVALHRGGVEILDKAALRKLAQAKNK